MALKLRQQCLLAATALLLLLHCAKAYVREDPDAASYAGLAVKTIPSAFIQALELLDLNNDTGPGEVKPLRKAILEAIGLLDVFSYAYPPMLPSPTLGSRGRQPHRLLAEDELDRRVKDMWQCLRDDLESGYQLLGSFQDLDHSLVPYSQEDADLLLQSCLDWQDRLLRDTKKLKYMKYVYAASDSQFYPHKRLSRFFWGFNGVAPEPGRSGMQTVAHLARDSQLARLVDAYPRVAQLTAIWVEPEHTEFHDFRKLVRSIMAVFQQFPRLISNSSHANSEVAATGSASAHASRRLRGAAAGGALTLLRQADAQRAGELAGMWSVVQRQRQGDAARVASMAAAGGEAGSLRHAEPLRGAASAATAAALATPARCCPSATSIVEDLGQLFHDLGQTNDKVIAYNFYKDRDMEEEADDAQQQAMDCWQQQLEWMADKQIDWMAGCLAASIAY